MGSQASGDSRDACSQSKNGIWASDNEAGRVGLSRIRQAYFINSHENGLYLKKYNIFLRNLKIYLAQISGNIYTNKCCGMIAVKREVAVFR